MLIVRNDRERSVPHRRRSAGRRADRHGFAAPLGAIAGTAGPISKRSCCAAMSKHGCETRSRDRGCDLACAWRAGAARARSAARHAARSVGDAAVGRAGCDRHRDARRRCRDGRTCSAPIDDRPTRIAVEAERACLAGLDGSCQTPLAAYAVPAGSENWHIRALIALPDGSEIHRAEGHATGPEAAKMGAILAARLRAEAGPAFLAKLELK